MGHEEYSRISELLFEELARGSIVELKRSRGGSRKNLAYVVSISQEVADLAISDPFFDDGLGRDYLVMLFPNGEVMDPIKRELRAEFYDSYRVVERVEV